MKFLSKRNKPIEAKAEHTQAVFAVDDLAALVADQFDKTQSLKAKVNSLEEDSESIKQVEQERDAAVISANRSRREIDILQRDLDKAKQRREEYSAALTKAENERDVYRAKLDGSYDVDAMCSLCGSITTALMSHKGNITRDKAASYVIEAFAEAGVE